MRKSLGWRSWEYQARPPVSRMVAGVWCRVAVAPGGGGAWWRWRLVAVAPGGGGAWWRWCLSREPRGRASPSDLQYVAFPLTTLAYFTDQFLARPADGLTAAV